MLFNKNNIKNYITALAVSLFVAILAAPTASHAQTVTCTGVGTETITTDSRVFFDYSANTCAVSDGTALGPDTGDSVFRAQVAGSEVFTVNLSGSVNTNVGHSGATIGTFTAAAGVASANNRNTNGAETASVTYSGPSSETIVMNVAYTIAGGGNSIDITSASVTITAAASSAATAQPKSLQASVSRSQLIVIGKNIGSRISSASLGGGVSGIGRDAPGGVGRTTPGGGTGQQGTQSNLVRTFLSRLAGTGDLSDPALEPTSVFGLSNEQPRHRSRGIKADSLPREVAMAASFDSSQWFLAAAGDQNKQNQPDGVRSRSAAQADRPFTVWGHGSYTIIDNDRNRVNDDSRYDGDVWGYNVGMD